MLGRAMRAPVDRHISGRLSSCCALILFGFSVINDYIIDL